MTPIRVASIPSGGRIAVQPFHDGIAILDAAWERYLGSKSVVHGIDRTTQVDSKLAVFGALPLRRSDDVAAPVEMDQCRKEALAGGGPIGEHANIGSTVQAGNADRLYRNGWVIGGQ
jgi:hypothetical protein